MRDLFASSSTTTDLARRPVFGANKLLALTCLFSALFMVSACSNIPFLSNNSSSSSGQTDQGDAAQASAAAEQFLQGIIDSHPEKICSVLNDQYSQTCMNTINSAMQSEVTKKTLSYVADTSITQTDIDPQTGAGTLKARVFGFDLGLNVQKQADGSWNVSF